jgi:hypothetical protein
MRTTVTRTLGALLISSSMAVPALADEVYPPGTECANLPTISARLLCGRQELKRGDAAAQQQQNVPPPPYDGYSSDPDQAQPPPGAPARPSPDGTQTPTPTPKP